MEFPKMIDNVVVNSRKELKELAETNAEAQYTLGVAFFEGDGVPVDYNKVHYYMKLAAEQSHSQALIDLAYCYKKGLGCEVDFQKVEKYLLMAEELGDEDAYRFLSDLYMMGHEGVVQDVRKGIEYGYKHAHSSVYNEEEEDITVEQMDMMYSMLMSGQLGDYELNLMASQFKELGNNTYSE